MRIVLAGALIAATALMLSAAPARAQMESREGIALQNEILAMQRDIQVLQGEITRLRSSPSQVQPYAYPYGAAPQPSAGQSDLTTQLLDRVSTLEDQVRQLRGRVDELTNQVQQMTADLTKQIGDLNFRLQQAGVQGQVTAPVGAPPAPAAMAAAPAARAGPPAGPPPSPPGQTSPAPTRLGVLAQTPTAPTTPTPRTPEVALQEGHAALARRDYAAAEADARQVLAKGRTPRASDAAFLLAEALAGQRNWQAAAVAYDDAYNRAKTGSHAADSLLGLANSLVAMNAKPAACGALAKLHAEFPNPRPDLARSINETRARAGCR